ncbi:hypothetical protein D3C73_1371440 [compost metagenome]
MKIIMTTQHNDLYLRTFRFNTAGQLKPVLTRHPYIGYDKMRLLGQEQLPCLIPILRFRTNDKAFILPVQNMLQALANIIFIVNNHDL